MTRSEAIAKLVASGKYTEAEASAKLDEIKAAKAAKAAEAAKPAEKPRVEAKAAPAPKKAAPVATPKKEAPKAPVAVDYTEEAVYVPEQVYGPLPPPIVGPAADTSGDLRARMRSAYEAAQRGGSRIDEARTEMLPQNAWESVKAGVKGAVGAYQDEMAQRNAHYESTVSPSRTVEEQRAYNEQQTWAGKDRARRHASPEAAAVRASAEQAVRRGVDLVEQIKNDPNMKWAPVATPTPTPSPKPAPKPTIYDLSGPTPTQNGKPMVKQSAKEKLIAAGVDPALVNDPGFSEEKAAQVAAEMRLR